MAGLLENKVVIVTGGGRGVGRGIALEAAREGAAVVVNDLGVGPGGEREAVTPASEVVREIQAAGGRAVENNDTVATWDGALKIVGCAMDSFGRVDGVVNNAGILRDAIFHKMDPADWLSVIDVHLNGSFFVSRAAAEQFRKQESGAYVHMASTSGLIGNFGQANYSAAKLGITALSKSIALDMARYNVRSNCIAPFAWSRMTSSIPANTDAEKARVERMKRMTPETNAPLAVFLASDAAREVTGQVFAARLNEIFLFSQPRPIRSAHMDGGWTPETIAERVLPAFKSSLIPMERSGDVFAWDPI